MKLSAVGQALEGDGEKIALEHAWDICSAAQQAGTTVTLDMEDHTTTDSTLSVLRELRGDYPWVGAVLQAYLRRTESDCRDLATAGSRVRLCKGAYNEPTSVAFTDKGEVDRSYVRCMKVLMEGDGYPMLATHDPRLIDIAGALAARAGRAETAYEYQMLYGIRPEEQQRLADQGHLDARLPAVRRRLVRLLHAPPGRAPGQRDVLPAFPRHPELTMTDVAGDDAPSLAGPGGHPGCRGDGRDAAVGSAAGRSRGRLPRRERAPSRARGRAHRAVRRAGGRQRARRRARPAPSSSW